MSAPADPHPLAAALIEAGRLRDGWDDEHQRLADRFAAAFGASSFWQSSRAAKEARCRELAQELVDLVAAPQGAPAEIDWWTALLRRRFADLGFWQAPKRWKQLAYEDVVREVYLAKEIVARYGPAAQALDEQARAHDDLGL